MNHVSRKLYGHEKLLSSLLNKFFNKKISNSIIFSGNKGIGKATFCFYLINEIYKNIDNNHDEITSSNHIYNNTHTNIRHITKTYDDKAKKRRNYITIDQFRNLESFINQSSLDNFPKFIIIDSADDLNKNSANYLLKKLEEPNINTFYILLSHQQTSILPTIKSRCIKFNFSNLTFDQFSLIVKIDHKDIYDEELKFLYDISSGSPGLAIEFYTDDYKNNFDILSEIFINKNKKTSNILELINITSNYDNDQFKIFMMIIKFILINSIKTNIGFNLNSIFISNITNILKNIAKIIDNSTAYNVLEYMNSNEADLYTYNLDKKVFTFNILSPLIKS